MKSLPRIIYNDDSYTLRTAPPPHTVATLAFEMPKFPHERDPYVYIYELDVNLTFGNG